MTNRRSLPRTSAPRSAVVHMLDMVGDRGHVTACGTRIGDDWAGEYTEQPSGEINCARCLPHLIKLQRAADAAADRDGGRIRKITHDETGDVIAEWSGCVVGVRFSSVADAYDWMVGDRSTRPDRCPLSSRGAVGDCVRAAGHEGQCASAHGDRYDGITRHEVPTGTADEVARFSRELAAVLSPRSWEEIGQDEARARSMAAHPAGKGRPVKLSQNYANAYMRRPYLIPGI